MTDESEPYRPTANEPEQDWPSAYLALFNRRLDDERVALMESEVARPFGGSLRKWEMTKAVRYCAQHAPNGGRTFAPNGEELIRAIKALRYKHSQARFAQQQDGHMCQMGYGYERAEVWMRLLKEAISQDERWNIICRPFDTKHCQQREKFCRDNGLEYEKYELVNA